LINPGKPLLDELSDMFACQGWHTCERVVPALAT
jgi:hypothetical protein